MWYLLQVYALVIAVVMLPVSFLYGLTVVSRQAIAVIRRYAKPVQLPKTFPSRTTA